MSWWQTFFAHPAWMEMYERFWTPEQNRDMADYLERVLELRPGDHVLDVPCGNGRIAIELAARGYRVTGVDLVPQLLDRARIRARERGVDVRWEQRDMRDLPWPQAFDAVCCVWGSFGYFDDAGNQAFLDAVARCLKPGGRFALDNHVTETLLHRLPFRTWHVVDDDFYILEEGEYDPETARVESRWVYVRQGSVTSLSLSQRLYSYRELVAMLHRAGFTQWKAWADTQGTPFHLKARRLYLVALK